MIIKGLVYVRNKLILYLSTKNNRLKQVILNSCEDIYILGTSNFEQRHYMAFSFIILGLAARIHFLVGMNRFDEIDEIFNDWGYKSGHCDK